MAEIKLHELSNYLISTKQEIVYDINKFHDVYTIDISFNIAIHHIGKKAFINKLKLGNYVVSLEGLILTFEPKTIIDDENKFLFQEIISLLGVTITDLNLEFLKNF